MQDLRSCASQDTVQSEQRSLEKRGLIYRTGSFAKGTQEAHRSPCCSANVLFAMQFATYKGREFHFAPPAQNRTCSFPARLVWDFLCQGISAIFVVLCHFH